jgi:hypothetical protein
VQPLPDETGQDPHGSKQRYQRALPPDLDQIRVHKRTPSRCGIGGYDRPDLIGNVKRRKELVNKHDVRRYPAGAAGSREAIVTSNCEPAAERSVAAAVC